MIKKKVCLLGAFAVGKTSLVQRFVKSIFSDKYHTTIGVKIDQKNVTVNGKELNLLLWDIHGEDEYQKIKPTYLMGSSAYFIVIDGTRKSTFQTAIDLQEMAEKMLGNKPFIVLINKSDLRESWEITDEEIEQLRSIGWKIILTSAKNGTEVEEAFLSLSQEMLNA